MLTRTTKAGRRTLPAALTTLALAALATATAHASPPPQPDAGAWVPDGEVTEVVHHGSRTIVGGLFNGWGPFTGAAVRVAPGAAPAGPTRGQAVVGGGAVLATISDGAGGAYIGGTFTRVNGQAHARIAHLTSSGNLDAAFNGSASGDVRALALLGSTLYVGGTFNAVAGPSGTSTHRENLAAFNAATGAVGAWAPCASSGSSDWSQDEPGVYALTAGAGTIYVAGNFDALTTINGNGCDEPAELHGFLGSVSATSGAATAWHPDPNDMVRTLLLSSGTLYAAGDFTFVQSNGSPLQRRRAVAYPAGSGTATGWDPRPTGDVFALAQAPSGDVVLGGNFASLGSTLVDRQGVARVNGTTGVVTSFDAALPAWPAGIGAGVRSLAVSGSHLLIGTDFVTGDRPSLTMADVTTGAAQPLAVAPDGAVLAQAALSGGEALVGGAFAARKTDPHPGLAVLDDHGVPTSLALAPGTRIDEFAVSPDGATIYAFGRVGALGASEFWKIDAATGAIDPNWDPTADSAQANAIQTMRVSTDGQTLYLGGQFTSIDDTPRVNAAAISTTTGTVTSWRPDPDGTVSTIVDAGASLYLGGYFQHAGTGAEARTNLARVSASTGAADGWAPTFDGPVLSAALSSDGARLYVIGDFTHVGTPAQPRGRTAALSTVTGNPTPFDGQLSDAGDGIALSSDGDEVYVTGRFVTKYGRGITSLTGGSGAETGWTPALGDADGTNVIDVIDDSAWLGSDSAAFGAEGRPFYAQFTSRPATSTQPALGGSGEVGATLTCGGAPWRNGVSSSSVLWFREDGTITGSARSYLVLAGDAGHDLHCQETATNGAGSTSAASASLRIAGGADGKPLDGNGTPPSATPAPTAAPLAKLTLGAAAKKARFARTKGSALTVTLSAPATVTVTISRCASPKGACKKPKKVRTIRKALGAGRSTVAIGEAKHRLATGRYTIAIAASAKDGRNAAANSISVSVTR